MPLDHGPQDACDLTLIATLKVSQNGNRVFVPSYALNRWALPRSVMASNPISCLCFNLILSDRARTRLHTLFTIVATGVWSPIT